MGDVTGSTRVYVGCGAKKQDSEAYAYNLYTSSYFQKKREYAELVGDSWSVLSALYGSLWPKSIIPPYDVTIDDYPLDVEAVENARYATLDEWAEDVLAGLEQAATNHAERENWDPLNRVIMLAGQAYLAPLRDGLDALAEEYGFEVVYPFDDMSGIGEQIGWLTEQIEVEKSRESTRDVDESEPETRVETVDHSESGTAEASGESGPEQSDLAGFGDEPEGS